MKVSRSSVYSWWPVGKIRSEWVGVLGVNVFMVWVTSFLFLNPNFWGYDPISRASFSHGLVQPPTRCLYWCTQFLCTFTTTNTPLHDMLYFFSCHSLPASMPHQPPTDDWLMIDWCQMTLSKKSPTGPTEWTPKKPEYRIALVSNLLGPESVGIRSPSIFDGNWGSFMWQTVQGYPYFAPWLVWYVSTIAAIPKKNGSSKWWQVGRKNFGAGWYLTEWTPHIPWKITCWTQRSWKWMDETDECFPFWIGRFLGSSSSRWLFRGYYGWGGEVFLSPEKRWPGRHPEAFSSGGSEKLN